MPKCKDCRNITTIQTALLEGVSIQDNYRDAFENKTIRFSYCPIVDIIVDVASEKNCGCFKSAIIELGK